MSDNNFLEGTTLTGKNDPDITYKFKNGEWYMVGSNDELISIDQNDFFKNQFNDKTMEGPALEIPIDPMGAMKSEIYQPYKEDLQKAEIESYEEDAVNEIVRKTNVSKKEAKKRLREKGSPEAAIQEIKTSSKEYFNPTTKEVEAKELTTNIYEKVTNNPASKILFQSLFVNKEDIDNISEGFDPSKFSLDMQSIKQIFDSTEELGENMLKSLLGQGFEVEQTTNFVMGNRLNKTNHDAIKITKNGESITLNFNIKQLGIGDQYEYNNEAYAGEFEKLVNFVNENADVKDIENFKRNVRSAKTFAEGQTMFTATGYNELYHSDSYQKAIYDKALDGEIKKLGLPQFSDANPAPGAQKYIDENGIVQYAGPAAVIPPVKKRIIDEVKRIDENEFFAKTTTSKQRIGGFDKMDFLTPEYRDVTKTKESKYKTEVNIAINNLKSQGVVEPTRKQIVKETRNVLVKDRIKSQRDKNLLNFMNSDEIKETLYDGKYKIGELLKSKGNAKDKSKQVNNYVKVEGVETNVDQMLNTKGGKVLQNIIKDQDEGKDIYSLYTEKEIESAASVQGKLIKEIVAHEELLDEIAETGKKIKDNDYVKSVNLASYDLSEKFSAKLFGMTEQIMFGSEYGLKKSLSLANEIFRGGKRNVKLDEEYLRFQEQQNKDLGFFQQDIAFGDAFDSVDNFGRFVLQEIANQAPIFASIAMPYNIGIGAISFMSMGEGYSEVEKQSQNPFGENQRNPDSIFLKGLGYGISEFIFNRFLALPMLKRTKRLLFDETFESMLKQKTKDIVPRRYTQHLLLSPAQESVEEGLTTITQNLLTGRPITENLGHAMFSGGMFGTGFGAVPFVKGVVMNQFSDYSTLENYRENLAKSKELNGVLDKLKISLKANTTKGNNTEKLQKRINTVESQIAKINQDQNSILEKEEAKLNDMDKTFYDSYNEATVRQQYITVEARDISKDFEDGKITEKERNTQLSELKVEFDQLQSNRDFMRSDKNFGNAYAGFKTSNKKEDVELRNEMNFEAETKLKQDGIADPTPEQIDNQTKLIYNTYRINQDFNNVSGILKEGGNILGRNVLAFQNFQTAQEAIDYINGLSDEQFPPDLKEQAIKVIEEGGHGANITTNNGDIIPYQVVENMAKDDRLETRTHELGHAIFRIAFANADFDQISVSQSIINFLEKTDSSLLTLLMAKSSKGQTDQKTAEEIIVNFFELVASGKIDLKNKEKSGGLGAFVASLIRGETKKVLGDNADYNFKGETDAVTFLITLAKKIKEGTITAKDIKDIRTSKILGDKVEKTTEEGAAVEFSEAKAKQDLGEVQQAAVNDAGTFVKEDFNPNDSKITSNLSGMVKAQISNLPINTFLTKDGRQELEQQTMVELFSRGDVAKFNGKGTLYGFINGRIKFSIKDAFKNNPDIVQDFNKADLDETMKRLEAEDIDVTPLDETLTDDTTVSDAKINVLALTNKESDIVKVVKPEGDYKQVIDNNVGEVGSKIFNIPAKKISDPKANITTSTKIVDVKTGKPLSKQDLKEGKKGILEPSEAKNIQDFFSDINTTKKFIKILPKENVTKKDADINRLGENIDVSRDTYGRGIGLPNRILNYFYQPKIENGKRVRSQGKTSQVPMWELKPEFSNLSDSELTTVAKKFQEDLGITKDGLTNVLPTAANRSKIGQLLKGAAVVMSQQASLSGAQRIKETQLKKTKEADALAKVKQEIADITTGQADIAFSENDSTPVGVKVKEGYIFPNGMLSEKRGIKLTPGSGRTRNKNAKFPKSERTYGEEFDLGLNRFLKDFPQHRSILRSTFGTYRGWYGNVGNYDTAIANTNVDQSHPKRKKYSKKGTKTFDPNYLEKIDDKFIEEQLNRLDVLYKFFKDVESHLANNPDDVWIFEEMLRDGTNDMSSIVRILAPFSFYPIFKNKKAIFNLPIVEEHTDPQNQVGKGLLFAAANGEVDAMWDAIGGSYMQGALLETHDPGGALKAAMPNEYYEFTIPLLKSGKLKLPKGYASIIRLALSGPNNDSNVIDLNQYMLVREQQTITEFFGVDTKVDITPEIIALQNETIIEVLTGQIEMSNAKKVFNAKLKAQQIIKPDAKARIDNSAAINKARATNINTESRGMSTWDFDDTLATTKSGVRATVPNPDGTPQPGRKVIFLAGGAGSGKSNVVKKLGLEEQGFKIVNSDISLEWLKKNSGLPENMNDLTREQLSELGRLQAQSRKISKGKMMKYQGNADGVVVDGTGGSIKAMEKLVKEFKDKGYDVSMVFVETSLETALERNANRKERSLLDKIVVKNHEAVQGNKEGFKEMFGERFMEVKTDNLTQEDAMPVDLTTKMNDFVSGYKKIRLDAEEFATQGADILAQGGEFDFSEFNVVTEGAQGPMFKTAMDRAKKFGTDHTYVLTARPQASAEPIQQFLASQGLNIPLENITGLGNSTGEAKAQWMLGKFAEGYNNMFFADDAMQNVEAVKNVLDQLDVKSEVIQAKIQFSRKMKSTIDEILDSPQRTKAKKVSSINNVKNINGLSEDGVYADIQFSKKHRGEYENLISKNRPDLVKEGLVSQTVDQMFNLVNGLDIPVSKRRKYEKIMTKWLATSVMKLPEDNYKLKDSVELAEKNNLDIFSYNNPNEIIEKYAGKSKAKPTNPNKVEEFGKGMIINGKYNIIAYEVQDTKEGMAAVREVVDTHFGPKSNPWCIISRKEQFGMDDAWQNWMVYRDGPKRIIFQDGKLISFYANDQYWDRMDNDTDHVVITKKKGNVTEKVELVPTGQLGQISEFVRERRTVSEDKNTVKTEYFVTKNMGEDTIVAGDYKIENRVNGQTVKATEYRPDGTKYNETNFKNGKKVSYKSFYPNGNLLSINTYGQPFGEISKDEVVKTKGDIIESMGTAYNVREAYHAEVLFEGKVAEVGIEIGKDVKIDDLLKTSPNGEIRLDLNKVLEADINARFMIPGVSPTTLAGALSSSVQFSEKTDVDINKILEQSMSVDAKKRFSAAQAKIRGAKLKLRGLVPPSAQDFVGLLYNFVGEGKQGEKHLALLKKALVDPFARGVNELNTARQNTSEDYRALLNQFPEVKKILNKKIGDTGFTVDQAVRVYLWNKAGFDVPGLSARDLKALDSFVKEEGSEDIRAFADALGMVSKKAEGYSKPGEYWLTENISSDLMSDGAIGDARAEFLQEWIENKNIIFSEDNLNKIEAIYGSKFREALEDMLYAMETGHNRPRGGSRLLNEYMNWVNGSVGAIMFFHVRSAVLQTISMFNYVNWSDNNPLKAAAAFANQPQFWSDFVYIFNSDMLKQRRAGNKRGINESELSQVVVGVNPLDQAKAIIRYLLKIGFLPTQIADSFAISMGGASFYRNRVNTYLKQGMDKNQAEKQAWLDFQESTEVSQQSARPDMISQQQRNPLGRLLLSFQNYPMQAGRIMNKAFRDLYNRRGDDKTNISKIIYYGFVANVLFQALQGSLFALLGSEDDEEKEKMIDKKKERMFNSIIDTWLSVFGYGGKAVSTVKNTMMEFYKQRAKDLDESFMTKSDHAYTILQALSFSPPIGSKARKIYQSIQTEKYNRDIIKERGFTLDNPAWSMIGNVIEGAVNIPLGRIANKMLNLDNAINSHLETWQRIALVLGWNMWDLGLKDPDIIALGETIKERKKQEKKMESEKKKFEKKREKLKEKYPDLDEKEIDVKIESEKYYPLRKYEQVELLKKLDLSDKEIKELKKESDRAEKINELYKGNEKLIDNYLKNSETKSKEDKDKEQKKLKPKKEKPTREKTLYKLNKKDQINLLVDLGLGPRSAYTLKTEKDRVNKILELEKKSKK